MMGARFSLLGDSVTGGGQGAKRKVGEELDSSMELGSPSRKRKKFMKTSQYIFKNLYQEGHSSDVTIVALGTEWKLHKIYLCQSRYFNSMFNGAWRETDENVVHVGVEDPNITIDALNIVFGSLYRDEITIDPAEVIPLMAAATLFQLDCLIEKCEEIMVETINIQTVIKYHEVAQEYGIQILQNKTFDWLLRNLTVNANESANCLKQISPNLMLQLISSPQLVVVQTEFSLYLLLKIWTFLKENPLWDGALKDCLTEAHSYFQELVSSQSKHQAFIDTPRGADYVTVFRKLRLQHLVMHHLDVEQLETDRIIPSGWFQPIFRESWFRMLRVNQGVDKGPKQVSEQEFDNQCIRCGRVLLTDSQHVWLWTGYQFGQDLIVSCSGRNLSIRRTQRGNADIHTPQTGQQYKRHLMYRFVVYAIDHDGQTNYTNFSGLKSVTLGKNEEVKVLTIDKEARFPILVSANFLMTTPLHSSSDQEMMEC